MGISACKTKLEAAGIKAYEVYKISELLRITLTSNICVFDNRYWRQTQGTAMGTPMAPSYSNLFLSELETRLINQTETRPWWWRRYIDDVVMIREHGDESLQEFMKYMNNNSLVKSNTSMEIPYLDTCITLKDGKWHTKIFIKPNAVTYIHARSGHSAQTKRNMIRNEAIRCLNICSLPSFFE
ncbi:hypothetical protein GJ496_000710 [Pomphorhynchus laevis]|nr:hypothetical protein GJ496_000710 [Pomphorhynchus laevis]